jgi:putative membrane protein
MTKLCNYFTLLLICTYIFYINYINRLAFFIHPRYLSLALFCASIIGVVAIAGIVHLLRTNKSILTGHKYIFSISFAILIATTLIFLIPVRSLSSESFALRSSNNGINSTDNEKENVRLKLKGGVDSSTFKFFDWVSAKNLNENGIFKDKKFKGVGFITASNQPNTFDLSRFIVSCCIVDATPVALLVEYDYQKQFKTNDWVEVEGVFAIKNIEGKNQPVIIPASVIKISEPDNTYLDRT